MRWYLREDQFCKLCGKQGELLHIKAGCLMALSQRRYRWWHDQVLSVIADILEQITTIQATSITAAVHQGRGAAIPRSHHRVQKEKVASMAVCAWWVVKGSWYSLYDQCSLHSGKYVSGKLCKTAVCNFGVKGGGGLELMGSELTTIANPQVGALKHLKNIGHSLMTLASSRRPQQLFQRAA